MKLEINQSKSFTIDSKKVWNETDIEIRNDEEYKFIAEGNWKDFLTKTDADGYTNWHMNLFNSMKRSKNNKWFALIGSLNKSDDFLIGSNNQISFEKKSGKLYCYANDAENFYWNNSGQISLIITRIK